MNDFHMQEQQSGTTLIEVLIALAILAISLISLSLLQVFSLKNHTSTYFRSQATFLAYNIIDRMKANRKAALNGEYNLPPTSTLCNKPLSSTTLISQQDKSEWLNLIACSINNNATGSIVQDNEKATISIQWNNFSGKISNQTEVLTYWIHL